MMNESVNGSVGSYLSGSEQRLGPAPRAVEASLAVKKSMMMSLIRDKRFGEVYAKQNALVARGLVVWGHIVQANTGLFKPGRGDLPANVLYSLCEEGNANPMDLSEYASGLFKTKGETLNDPEMQRFSDLLADEVSVESLRIPIPPKMTGGIQCYLGSIMVFRKHLPNGYLSGGLFPMLVLPAETIAVMILPSVFWDPDFTAGCW